MSFLFASSHLPETRVQRPEDEEENAVQPMLHSGGVRAFSHLPTKRVAAGPISQRGAQAIGRQFQRTEREVSSTRPEDGISAAKASGIFELVRQQYNRDDSPHFMDEDGNLRPRDETRQQDSLPRIPRSPLGVAGAPPRPAWGTGNAAAANSSRSPLTQPSASDDTRPWHTPAITPEDLDPQHFDDDDATGSHSGPKGRPEVQDLVYRTHATSTPKPGLQDLVYRFNGRAEEEKNNNSGFYQNAADPANASPHTAQQTRTYSAPSEDHSRTGSTGSTGSFGYSDKPVASISSTDLLTGQNLMDRARKRYNPELDKAERAFETLLNKQRDLRHQAEAAGNALSKLLKSIRRLEGIRMSLKAAEIGQDIAKEEFPVEGTEEVFDFLNELTGLAPDLQIKHLDAEIAAKKALILEYWQESERANVAVWQAEQETKEAGRQWKQIKEKQKQLPR